ncbi:hypothetical protein E2C01_073608 [Portunus trituberculatus]|uniref:Uncharacterized protein n=1 Tax=Portunus trituberculatus TaxID=210409 RepID=A0A5B7IA61_PORTR|nr:hypothetical protein [Portunus trituberculatus]
MEGGQGRRGKGAKFSPAVGVVCLGGGGRDREGWGRRVRRQCPGVAGSLTHCAATTVRVLGHSPLASALDTHASTSSCRGSLYWELRGTRARTLCVLRDRLEGGREEVEVEEEEEQRDVSRSRRVKRGRSGRDKLVSDQPITRCQPPLAPHALAAAAAAAAGVAVSTRVLRLRQSRSLSAIPSTNIKTTLECPLSSRFVR